uniref:Intermembrane lipid transfer protein VPS13-like C-terminal domain-containing protein n=1 Tax=Guillardia theta TaxID=55529 RepID=A0A6U6DH86_GUITH|mmetsp:Transcript_5533/g.19452  ORF Transcript_5533/g.19452 Transcript_5533/m.19452 type:complete len:192 (+) Transcript_5533:1207-1782(+)
MGGLLSGLGKGFIGGMLKPTAGVLEFASRSTQGLASMAMKDPSEYGGRARPPRAPSRDGVLRCYDLETSAGLDILKRFDGGKYSKEHLVLYCRLQGTDAVMLTDKRLVVMEVCTLEKRWKVDVSDISSVKTTGSGVIIHTRPPSMQDIKFFKEALGVTNSARERQLNCGDLEQAEYIVSSITACCMAGAAQ